MAKLAVIKNKLTCKFNQGLFLSAKIQSDLKKNVCDCGGAFDSTETFKGYQIPCCSTCGENPKKLRIRAQVVTISGKKERIEIRYDQKGDRLTDAIDCLATIKMIEVEIEKGDFDVRKYQSKKLKENFEFKKFIDKEYIPYHKNRYENGEITKSGYRHKVSACNKLKDFYKNIDISTFKDVHIENFRTEYKGTAKTISDTLSDLNTILKFAKQKGYLRDIPLFPAKVKSKVKKDIMNSEEAFIIISHADNKDYQDVMMLLSEYPVRPCEIPVLECKNIDFINEQVTFESHYSDGEITEGRKSQKIDDKYGSLTLPFTSVSKKIFTQRIKDIYDGFGEGPIFKGKYNKHLSLPPIQKCWSRARKSAIESGDLVPRKNVNYGLYELKHIKLSEAFAKTGNLKTLEKISGVNAQTLMKHYVYSTDNVLDLFA